MRYLLWAECGGPAALTRDSVTGPALVRLNMGVGLSSASIHPELGHSEPSVDCCSLSLALSVSCLSVECGPVIQRIAVHPALGQGEGEVSPQITVMCVGSGAF